MNLADLLPVVDAAKVAFDKYKLTTAKERHDLLIKFFHLLSESSQDIASLIVLENGKSLADAKGEATYAASFLEWFAGEALRTYGDVIPTTVPGVRNVVIKQPIGVVAALCPWNFPAAMITRKIAPALAAGCSVIVSGSSSSYLCQFEAVYQNIYMLTCSCSFFFSSALFYNRSKHLQRLRLPH